MVAPSLEGSGTLILVPTHAEARLIEGARRAQAPGSPFALCGFGPIAAAAATARELARIRPSRVLLVGIAGTFDGERHPIGSALCFGRVRLDGVGAGEGEAFASPRDLGFPQWPGQGPRGDVFDALPLQGPPPETAPGPTLLTVCSCSASRREARRRRGAFDDPAAEDMEGFGVALACHQFEVPLAIVRGLSNSVGDRDAVGWEIESAMEAAWELGVRLLAGEGWGR